VRARVAAVLVPVVLIAGGARAQVVRGVVVDGVSQGPLYGAMVAVYDTAGNGIAGAFTDDSGRFAVRLPAAGRYRLRVERVGYASAPAVEFTVRTGETIVEHLDAATAVVRLPTDTVTVGSRCVIGPSEGVKTAALWEEARKVLFASQLAGEERTVAAVRKRWWRSLDGTSLNVRRDSTVVDSVDLAQPFRTLVTPDDLERYGYGVLNERGDSALAGPDAHVLLSESFAHSHCFHVRLDSDKHAGMIGLAFEPARKVSFPEVTGVLWLDSASARLRYVEFRHTNLYPEVSPLRYGGRMDFMELGGGVWIVGRWYIRLPVVANGPNGSAEMRFLSGAHVTRFHEEGGEVLRATVHAQAAAAP